MNSRFAAMFIIGCMLLMLTGPGAAQNQPAQSAFAGEYVGPFVSTGLKQGYRGDRGNYVLSIADNGKIKGSTKSDINGAKTLVAGTVDKDGKMLLTVRFTQVIYTMKGKVYKTKSGHIKGTLLQYAGSENVASDEIDLSPK